MRNDLRRLPFCALAFLSACAPLVPKGGDRGPWTVSVPPEAVAAADLVDADDRVRGGAVLDLIADGGNARFFLLSDGSFTPLLDDQSVPGGRVTVRRAPSNGAVMNVVHDAWLADAGGDLVVLAPGVLANDRDPEGDPLSARLVRPPAHGRLLFREDGSFSYRPEPSYSGEDSFDYAAGDGRTESAPVTVPLRVLPPPETRKPPDGTGHPPEAGHPPEPRWMHPE